MSFDPANILTQSRIRDLCRCPKRHYWRYEVGLVRSETPSALRIGSLFHLAMEALATIKEPRDTPEREQAEYAAIRLATDQYDQPRPSWIDPDAWEVERQIVYRMLFAYRWRWNEADLEFVSTEQMFRQPLGHGDWMKAGIIDKIVRTPDGQLCVMEHKTASDDVSPGSAYWQRRRMDRQIAYYVSAARELGYDVSGVIYDVMRKPLIRPRWLTVADTNTFLGLNEKKLDQAGFYNGEGFSLDIDKDRQGKITHIHADGYHAEFEPMKSGLRMRETPTMFGARVFASILESPESYFARERLPVTDLDVDTVMDEARVYAGLIDHYRSTRWPRNTDSCDDWGGCEYFPLCVSHSDGHNAHNYGLEETLDLFPELTERERRNAESAPASTSGSQRSQAEPKDSTANTL